MPFFVRRACTSPSGASRCTLRACVEQRVEPGRPFRARHRLGARPVDDLDRRAAANVDRRGGDSVHDELPPAVAERPLMQLLHASSVPTSAPRSSGGGRRMNEATTRSSSAASGASVGSARATAASPACHSTPCGPTKGRTHDDLALGDEERATGSCRARPARRCTRPSGAAAACGGSPAPRLRARRSGPAAGRRPRSADRAPDVSASPAASGSASSSVSHSTPCRARDASCARLRLVSGPSSVGCEVQTTLSPRRRR